MRICNLIFFSIIFSMLSLRSFGEKNTIIYVKFCSNDCASCNLPLTYLLDQLKNEEVRVVFAESDLDSKSLSDIQNYILQGKGKVLFSDKLFYKFDSGSRSSLFVVRNDVVYYRALLKEASISEIRDAISKSLKLADDPQTSNLITLEKYHLTHSYKNSLIVFNFQQPFSLVIDKTQLNTIKDTLVMINDSIKKAILRKRFGDLFLSEINKYDAHYKDKPLKIAQITCIQLTIQDDKIFALYLYKYVNNLNQAPLISAVTRIENEAAILTFSLDGKLLEVTDLSNNLQRRGYSIGSGGYFRFQGSQYMCVQKEKISDTNYVLGSIRNEKGRILIDTLIGELSLYQKLSGLGYHSNFGLKESNGFFMSSMDNNFFDVRNFHKYHLSFIPDYDINTRNTYSYIQDFSVDTSNHIASLIYSYKDSMYLASCELIEGKAILKSKIALWHRSVTEEVWFGENGFYRYLPKAKVFEFVRNEDNLFK